MSGYNPNRDSGIAQPRSYAEIEKDSIDGLVEESEGVPESNQRYFAQLVYNVGATGGNGMTGYNPNRDSGIAEPRNYVEVNKEDLQGLVDEYDFVPDATKRYFAKLVYNVGPGGGGGGGSSDFTPTQVTALKQLLQYKDALIGLSESSIKTIIINLDDNNGTELDANETIIPVVLNSNTNQYEIIQDVDDIDGNGDNTEYMINIPGYVCAVECYVLLNNDQLSTLMERFLPKSTYIPAAEAGAEYPYGKSIIFLNKEHEYDLIKALPQNSDNTAHTIKISYIQLGQKNPTE